MPQLSGNGIAPRPRTSYGKRRSMLSTDESEEQHPVVLEPHLSQQSNEGPKQAAGLKRGRTGASGTPPQPKRASLTAGSGMPSMSKTPALHDAKDSIKGPTVTLRASQELRETGQNHKFRDGIEFILDGVRSKDSLRIRRSSCLELIRSMLKEDYIAQVKAHCYMTSIFEATHRDEDSIVQSCLALMIGLLLQDPDGCKDIVAIDGMVQFLCQSMEVDMDPMSMMPSGQQEVVLFNKFKDMVRQSGILRKGQKVLIKSIVLSSTASIIQECVALEDVHVLSIVEQDPLFLTSVVQLLIEDLAWIKEPSSTPGVFLSDVLDIGRIENSLRILEHFAMVSSKPAAVLANNSRLFPLLVHLITLCRMHAFQYPQQTESVNIMLHTLRLLINVTNGNEPCCEGLSQGGSIPVLVQNFVQFYGHCRNYHRPEESLSDQKQQELTVDAPVLRTDSRQGRRKLAHWTQESSSPGLRSSSGQTSQNEESALSSVDFGSEGGHHDDDDVTIGNNSNGWYDLLLLSLGLLINMLEAAPPRRKQLTETAIGLDCRAIGDCFHKECRCDKSLEALERLVDIYNTEVIISEMTEDQVLAAYLALLLCCVVGGSANDEARLYKSVHGQSLAPMLELLQGFVALQAIQLDGPDQQQSSKELLEPTSSLSTDGSLSPAEAFMPQTLDSDCGDKEDGADGDDCQAAEIVFVDSTKRAAETQASFIKIIHLLQDMESRQVRHSK